MNAFTRKTPAVMSKPVARTDEQDSQQEGDMGSPNIQPTKDGFTVFVPKHMVWILLTAAVVGQPTLTSYLGNRAGLVTKDELKAAVSEAVKESMDALEARVARIERAAKAKEKVQ